MGALANPGLPMTASMHYTSTMVLYTAMDEVRCVVDGAPPGPNGRLFIVPPNKPTKVPYIAGKFILEHLAYTGVVRVEEVEEELGITYLVDEARESSLALGKEQDGLIWRQYISDMMDDYIARRDGKNKVPPPPPQRILNIINRRGYKLSDYGIKPLGFQDPVDVESARIKQENASMKLQLADLNSKFETLIRMQTGQTQQNKPTIVEQPKTDGEQSAEDLQDLGIDAQATGDGVEVKVPEPEQEQVDEPAPEAQPTANQPRRGRRRS